MRLRKKKHLEERIANVSHLLLARTEYTFYSLDNDSRYQIVNLQQQFGNNNAVVVEIGCGKGGYANSYAKTNCNVNIIAVEKLSNVIVEACERTAQLGLTNVKYLNCSAENLLYYLPPNSITSIILNFSCPFPKSTYANRRLTSPKMLQLYNKLLVNNGTICQKTDDAAFFDYSVEQYSQCNYTTLEYTRNLYESPYIQGNIATEYETKFHSLGKPILYTKVRCNNQ